MSGKSIKRGLTGSKGEKSSLSKDIRFLLSFFILIAAFTCMAEGVDIEPQSWKQDDIIDDNLVDGGSENSDKFGSSLASGDFNGDNSDDLAVGVPGEGLGNISSAGAVNVIYGDPPTWRGQIKIRTQERWRAALAPGHAHPRSIGRGGLLWVLARVRQLQWR